MNMVLYFPVKNRCGMVSRVLHVVRTYGVEADSMNFELEVMELENQPELRVTPLQPIRCLESSSPFSRALKEP